MGIFSKWDLFAKAEVILERKLQANPFYPFKELDSTSAFNDSLAVQPGPQEKGIRVRVKVMILQEQKQESRYT